MKKILLLLLMALSISQAAVHVNPNGLGEVLLIPYYTTNNGLNTNVTVSNTTEQVKAVKIIFRGSQYDWYEQAMNVYLAPYDTWSFGLVNRGNDADVISNDLSCVPFFSSPLQLYDNLADPTPPDGFGYAEGTIEVYEMGELDPSYGYGEEVTFEDGQPIDCQQIVDNWDAITGEWATNDKLAQMLPATGGLKAAVSLINVSNGVNYTYDAIALNDFYPDETVIHTRPDDHYSPSMSDADKISKVPYQGRTLMTEWTYGFEAVSAALSKNELLMDYSNELNVNAQTEVILSFPTKHEHRRFNEALMPFGQPDTLFGDCERFSPTVFDRDGQGASYVPGSVSPVPPHLCKSTNVIKIWDVYDSTSVNYPILDSEHTYNQSIYKGKEGMYKIKFNQFTANGRSLDGSEIHTYHGLPVFALALTRYTNANAQPGLLAQYGGAFVPSSQQKIEIEQADQ